VAVLIGVANGYRRGFWLSVTQYIGMVAGVVLGAALGPRILDALNIQGTTAARPWAAALVLVVCGSLGSTLGYWLGDPVRRAFSGHARPGGLEVSGGAVFSGLSVLLTCWFLGLSLDRGPSPDLARLIQGSAVLRGLDGTLPPPPGVLSGVEKTLAGVPFPQTFAGLGEPNPAPLQLPASIDTSGINAAVGEVYKVEGQGCGGIVTGSAYVVARGYLVTNAHVVAGTSGTRVSLGSGPHQKATVVLFDAQRDVAILSVPSLTAPALPIAPASRGTQGAVIGYPGGGDETVQPAVVSDQKRATGRDIYNDQLVDRDIWILQSVVRPGNSGGPVVDLQGHVLGLVFAASSTRNDQAYALTNQEVQPDVARGIASTTAITTSTFSCAV
jgi:S1-C subfamily serine protease